MELDEVNCISQLVRNWKLGLMLLRFKHTVTYQSARRSSEMIQHPIL